MPLNSNARLISPAGSAVVPIRDLQAGCVTCGVADLCLPSRLEPDVIAHLDALVGMRRRIRKRDAIYRTGDPFDAIYAIRTGSCKTTVHARDGREQVCGYYLRGDIIGMDAVHDGRHAGQAIALEYSEVCALPFDCLEELAREVPALQHSLHLILLREIDRGHKMMLMLGTMSGEERLAGFLLNLAHRHRERGYSSTEFILRMTRREIGSYLGLTPETVCRLLSRFRQQGLIQLQRRAMVKLLDVAALKRLTGPRSVSHSPQFSNRLS